MSSLFFLSLHLLYLYLPLLTRASADGSLALFLDEQCEQASIINPTVQVAADVCLVTKGALGIAVEVLPPCASGEASVQLYDDTSCANPLDMTLDYGNCYFAFVAVVFQCTAVAGGSHATATSTVSAGSSSIPIAAGTPASPTGNSPGDSTQQNTPSNNEAAATSSSDTIPTSTNAIDPIPTSTSPTRASTTGAAGSASGSGLSQRSQIGLGVGLPVGSIVVALLAWLCPGTRRIVRSHRPGANRARPSLGQQAERGYQMWNSTQSLVTTPGNSNAQPNFAGNPIANTQSALPSW